MAGDAVDIDISELHEQQQNASLAPPCTYNDSKHGCDQGAFGIEEARVLRLQQPLSVTNIKAHQFRSLWDPGGSAAAPTLRLFAGPRWVQGSLTCHKVSVC